MAKGEYSAAAVAAAAAVDTEHQELDLLRGEVKAGRRTQGLTLVHF